MRVFLLFLWPFILWAETYFARVEPLRTYTIAAEIAGRVERIDKNAEGRVAGKGPVVMLENTLKTAELEAARIRHENLQESYEIRKKQVERNAQIASRSPLDRENDRLGLLDLQAQLASAKENHVRLSEAHRATRVAAPGLYIYRILVEEGSFVNVGTPLLTAQEIGGSRLVIFMRSDAINGLEHKEIMVEGAVSNYRVDKLWQVADDQQISAYRVELVGPPPIGPFSQVVKVEFRLKEGKNP